MNEQFKLFFVAIMLGIIGGLVYGIISIFRKYVIHNIVAVYIEDIIFWVIYALTSFLVMLTLNYGDIRPYIVFGVFIGLIIYVIFIHRLVIKLLSPIITIIRLFIEIILTPFDIILYPFKKLLLFLKNYLQISKKCEKIKQITKSKLKKR